MQNPLWHVRWGRVLLPNVLLCLIAGSIVNGQSPPQATTGWHRWLEDLDHDEFQTRRRAKEALLKWSNSAEPLELHSLLNRSRERSVETRLATDEILHRRQLAGFDEQVEQLTNSSVDARQLASRGWEQFARGAGRDMVARRCFAKLCGRHPASLHSLTLDSPTQTLDPNALDRGDTLGWLMVLSRQCVMAEQSNAGQESGQTNVNGCLVNPRTRLSVARLSASLSDMASGPRISLPPSSDEEMVLARWIQAWLEQFQPALLPRARLRISIRYQCDQLSSVYSQQVLSDPHASPANLITAMLVAAKSNRSEWIERFSEHLDDNRTAHVWQAASPPGTKIRTQVRDAAMALMLHCGGIDPRECGFSHLQADPRTLFCESSLGFEDDEARYHALAAGKQFLAAVE